MIGNAKKKHKMTSISHALIGAAIAARFQDPITVSTVAVITHFACDIIPHWDLGTNWRLRPRAVTGVFAMLETLTAVVGTYVVFYSRVPSPRMLVLAIVASLIPDWLEVPYYLTLPRPPKLFQLIYKAQSLLHTRAQKPIGVVTQIVVVAAFLVVGFLV